MPPTSLRIDIARLSARLDAPMVAPNCPSAMIFVPSRGGLSHNIGEYTAPDEIEAGANVLLSVVIARAGIAH